MKGEKLSVNPLVIFAILGCWVWVMLEIGGAG